MTRIYLDHNATSPLRPEARETWMETLQNLGGNPSSVHTSGRAARAVIDRARERVAGALGVTESGVFFTSSGTEANNLALLGTLRAAAPGSALTVLASDHASVLEPARHLESEGHELRLAPVGPEGLVDVEELARIARGSALLSLAAANNETGALVPLGEVREALGDEGPPVHTDAAQALGRIPLDFAGWGVDLATLSAHKVGGPVGVGILVRCTPQPLRPVLFGGGQEGGLRPGTENAAAIAAAARAIELSVAEQGEASARWRKQTSYLWNELRRALPHLQAVGPPVDSPLRLPNTLNVLAPEVEGRVIVTRLDLEGLEVSAGSACSSGSLEPSHVLTAMGFGEESARSAVRLSLGRETDDADVCRAVEILSKTFSLGRKSG
ncbi:MAG: cysteine desulfurase family protein [Planctomycetota bacterium]|nr:cysteine desulfurase family protein [Planctomycetota bacterium]